MLDTDAEYPNNHVSAFNSYTRAEFEISFDFENTIEASHTTYHSVFKRPDHFLLVASAVVT